MSNIEKPNPVDQPDITSLKNIAESFVDFVDSEDFHEDNDFHHYVFETAMETIYGPTFWAWFSQRTK